MKETVPDEISGDRPIHYVDHQAQDFREFLKTNSIRPIILLSLLAPEAHHSCDEHFFTLASEYEVQHNPPPKIIKKDRWFIEAYGSSYGIDALKLGIEYSLKFSNASLSIVPYIHFAHAPTQWLHPDKLSFCQEHNIKNTEFYLITRDQMDQLKTVLNEVK